MDSSELDKLFPWLTFYLSTAFTVFHFFLNHLVRLSRAPLLFTLVDTTISFYFRLCNLSPVAVDLDDQTTVHFWTSTHRRHDRPNLVMIHGYGADARWQFIYQVGALSRKFNLYVPDLVFFGKSYSKGFDRTVAFQASCVVRGLKGLGVDRFSVYSISYGGYVAYRMAEMCPRELEKLVIVSSGVGFSDDQKEAQVRKVGRDPREVLLPENPNDLRLLVSLSVHKGKPLKWAPDFFLQDFINAMANTRRKEKLELVEHLLDKKPDEDLPVLTQETLLIWGDQDQIFPLYLAYQLQRHLGPKAKLEIIKNTGHAVNMDSPEHLNHLITTFVLEHS